MDAALAGELDEKRLNALLLDYATVTAANNHRDELRQRSEKLFTEQFHRSLRGGCAEEILSSLRPHFEQAAEQIATARDLIPADTPAEAFLRTAKPNAVEAWQQLDGHLGTVSSIGRVATSFGPRGDFPVFDEYALSEGFKVSDTAIFCTSGPLEYDSAIFLRGTGIHRASPWFKVSLKLNAVAEARARYREWCADEWDLLNSGSPGSVVGEDGKVRELPRPKNPFKAKESVT